MMIDFSFSQKGWECPRCNNIMSPTMPVCFYCVQKSSTTTNTTATSKTKCFMCSGTGKSNPSSMHIDGSPKCNMCDGSGFTNG